MEGLCFDLVSMTLVKTRERANPEHASIFFLVLLFRRPVSPVYDLTAAYGDISVPEMNNRRFFFAFGASNSRRAAGLQ